MLCFVPQYTTAVHGRRIAFRDGWLFYEPAGRYSSRYNYLAGDTIRDNWFTRQTIRVAMMEPGVQSGEILSTANLWGRICYAVWENKIGIVMSDSKSRHFR